MANIVQTLSERVASSVGAKVNYGEKIEIGGVEAVPVSFVSFGFGGGSAPEGSEGEGEGGGGGGASIPIGMFVPGENGPRFVPALIPLLAVAIPLTWVAGKALSRVIRALKK
ncbi:hypothetical protein OH146_03330 [Salinibacterium sp. SYSU T00001]|uniref:hypothetical protein n=1 Tax=Homoserinimonas sedimenticola TaxID=2986805 RepID=UPI002235D467|nr:hypothetical protein [Salinibacterium sedimenticola]MCW4384802.1 hypothetical protein [Salinibacterium sedimenticola]